MMSILISGMEMPTSCYGCPFFVQVDYWNNNDEADILSKCKRTGEFTWESVNGYLPNCPLVPVQEHGQILRVLKTERECVSRDCDRNCRKCDLSLEREEIVGVYDALIAMLDPPKEET